MRRGIFAILFVIIGMITGRSQIVYFNYQYDHLRYGEIATDFVALDSTYLITGGTSENYGAFILQIDEAGEEQTFFSHPVLPGWFGLTPHGIFLGEEEDYYIQGTIVQYEPSEEAQLFLTNYDLDSHTPNWTFLYGSDSLLEGTGDAIRTSDGGFAITGWIYREEPLLIDQIYLMKISNEGDLEYYHHYTADSTRKSWGISLVETPDQGFMISGFERRWQTPGPGIPSSVTDLLLLKVDAAGEQEWLKFHRADIDNHERIKQPGGILINEDGNFYICGHRTYFEPNSQHYALYKFNVDGELIWEKQFGRNQWAKFSNLICNNSGNLVFAGYELDFAGQSLDRRYGVIASTTAQGDSLWLRKYYLEPQGADVDQFNDLMQTPDGGYIAIGDTYGQLEDSTYQNVWVIKTDSLGCLEPDCDGLMTATEERPAKMIEIQLYPNPTASTFTIELPTDAILLGLQLFDATGRKVDDIQFFRSQAIQQHNYPLHHLANGIYTIRLRTDQGWWSGRVVKK